MASRHLKQVVSLFDGMACGLQALKEAGYTVGSYHAFEIDKYAMQIAKKNHPEIIHHGSVENFPFTLMQGADLVIGGSPCQGFSVAGKGLAFDDPRSKLFFEFVRAVNEIKPRYFLLENVKMKKEWLEIINQYMGVKPVLINSALVSAQNRNRYYWCNWNVEQPEDRGIYLKDIIESGVVDEKYYTNNQNSRILKQLRELNQKAFSMTATMYKGYAANGNTNIPINFNINPSGRGMNGNVQHVNNPKSKTLTTNKGEGQKILITKPVRIGKIDKGGQGNRIYSIDGKSITLSASSGGLGGKTGLYVVPEATKKGFVEIPPNCGVDLTFPNSKTRRGRKMENKSNCLTAASQDYNWYDGLTVRKLTPIECERLQTLPDNYTEGVSNTQRYKMLGNGWTVAVIKHILEQIPHG